MKINFIKIPFIILTMSITFPISIKAIVIGKAVAAFLWLYINGYLIGKFYNFGTIKQLLVSWKYSVSSIIMEISTFIVDNFFYQIYSVWWLGYLVGFWFIVSV